jgi:hypothetical protein
MINNNACVTVYEEREKVRNGCMAGYWSRMRKWIAGYKRMHTCYRDSENCSSM